MGNNDLSIALGALVTVITGFGVIAKLMLNQASKDRDSDRAERHEFIKAINGMSIHMKAVADTNKTIASATARGADEAKERNGHLAELITKQGDVVQAIADKATDKIITGIGTQHVDTQNVDKQIIGGTE